MAERFEAQPVLARLKDFQRCTVDAVFQSLYLDDSSSRRFLVADEVGLGKTLVARGVIARALEHLHDKVERIDIVYVCSNAAIAAQNINRLNVLGQQEFAMASRLTLLPTQVEGLKRNPINFVSFTPGTTFDLKSRGGVMRERAVLFRMLRDETWLDRQGLLHLLQGPAGREGWERMALQGEFPVDPDLAEDFRNSLRPDQAVCDRLADLADRFRRYRDPVPPADLEARYTLIGELRQRLARVCLKALEPDLVILDEFQRFRELLDGEDSMASLARDLFAYPDVRVLLLSATPYKLLSLNHETDDDHYSDFLRTMGFLFNDNAEVEALKADLQRFRLAMLGDQNDISAALHVRDDLEARLLQVMCRTERVGMTRRLDSMLSEIPLTLSLEKEDLEQALLTDQVALSLEARDPIEYWKSSPYLLNFMKNYDLRQRLREAASDPSPELLAILQRHEKALLRAETFRNFSPIASANARMRTLMDRTIDRGLWRLLWMPPSLPYWNLGGAYAETKEVTKALVFSEWNVVPDAIATLCSYEAERRMVAGLGREVRYDKLDDIPRPLRFARGQDNRMAGMPVLALLYPSPFLASVIDPLAIALSLREGSRASGEEVIARVAQILFEYLRPLATEGDRGPEDQRWYWAAIALLDAQYFPQVGTWCRESEGWRAVESEPDEGVSLFREHLEHFSAVMEGRLDVPLGRMPADLPDVLARWALAGPGVTALRALRRVAPELAWDQHALLGAAAAISSGFRTLFNLPETIALLRGEAEEGAYWRRVLEHGLDGNLQALLDEHVHVLRESLGVMDKPAKDRVEAIATNVKGSLSLRSASLHVDELTVDHAGGHMAYPSRTISARCRFALRFGELKDDKEQTLARVGTVQDAFNSPFRPFILASTSIGQEGLDFHLWCHAVVHWNLPANPVDFEQREGRVHRYKGHAVRKNVAQKFGMEALSSRWRPGMDPWAVLFESARDDRPAGSSDMVPYWVYELESGATVERWVPMLPLSREVARYEHLKKNLALYRMVFGQPRQEDLLAYLTERMPLDEAQEVAARWRLSLSPSAAARKDDEPSAVGQFLGYTAIPGFSG